MIDRDAGPRPGRRRRDVDAAPRASFVAQTSAWRRSFAAIRRNAAGALVVLLDRGERVVEEDRVALEAQVGEALGRLGGHRIQSYPALDSAPMTAPDAPPLRYLTARPTSSAAMPPLDERLRLAERTMVALVDDAELPPKIGVHPRPDGSFAHAMPAHLRGADPERRGRPARDQVDRRLPGQPRRAACPRSTASSLLTDPRTGVPTAILDAGPITAERTAAISGVAIARFAPRGRRSRRAGRRSSAPASRAGATSRSSATSCPALELTIFDRHPDRAAALADEAARTAGHRRGAMAAATRPRRDRDRPTSSSRRPRSRRPTSARSLTDDWLAPDALVVAVDYATYCAAAVAREAALFLVDQREQFLANRDAGQLRRLPGSRRDARRGDPRGHAAAGARPRRRQPPRRRAGRSRLRRRDPRGALERGLGTVLPR